MLNAQEKTTLLAEYPNIAPFVCPYVGADSFINGLERFCLWLVNCTPEQLRATPPILERIEAVRRMRLESTKLPTREKAKSATLFTEIRQPKSGNYLAFPRTSSENRDYIPIGFLPSTSIAANDIQMVPGASTYHFGVLTSTMHMLWVKTTSGRLKSDYRYSARQTYNPFPWPQNPTSMQVKTIEEKAQGVLDVRTAFPDSTLADLYDPLTMPPALLRAHQALDRAVDVAYRKQSFDSERHRVEFLFDLYQKYTAPLAVEGKKKKSRTKPKNSLK